MEAVGICRSDLETVALETQEVCHPRLPDAAEPGRLDFRSEELVGSEQAVRLLEVSRDPGRHSRVGGVGVPVSKVRGGLFGYPPKKFHCFGERAPDVSLIVVSECLMEFVEDVRLSPGL